MPGSIQSLLVNYLFILVVVFLVQLVQENKRISHRKRQFVWFCAMALSLVFGVAFPFQVTAGHIFDLRLLPIILGTLYGGWRIGLALLAVFAVHRFSIGGGGAFPAVSMLLVVVAALCPISSLYTRWRPSRKLLFATVFTAAAATYNFSMFLLLFSINIGPPKVWASLIGINAGGVAFLIIYIELIRYHFRLEEQLVHNEKLETISQLAAAVSHEVRNPLTTSRGFMQLLMEGDMEQERRKSFLKIAIDELDRAEGIIRDYLNFAKPASEQPTVLQLHSEIARIIEIITPFANMNTVSVTSQLSPCQVKGESQLFTQSLLNIAKNAIEAMGSGGTLHIALTCDQTSAYISIHDTGCGMTSEQIQRLGEPYFSTKGTKGTGLGMLVTYRIIQSMGGRIDVQSQLGKGTTFFVTLPI